MIASKSSPVRTLLVLAIVLSPLLPPSLTGAAASPIGRPDDDPGKLLGLELSDLGETTRCSPAVIRRISAVTGLSPASLAGLELRTARTVLRDGRTVDIRIASLETARDGRVVAASHGISLLRVGLVKHEGWHGFLKQFRGRELPDLDSARGVPELIARIAEADLGRVERADELRALLAVRRVMMTSAAHLMPLWEGGESLTAASRAALAGNAERLEGLAEDLPLGRDREAFVEAADAFADYVEALPDTAADMNADRQARLMTAARGSCMRCHALAGHDLGGTLETASKSRREEHGVGDGYFVVLHDVIPRLDEAEASQRLATAIRATALALGAAD